MALKRFGVSLEEEILQALDAYVVENGFANRSQAIRFLVEKGTVEEKWQCNHIVAGAVLVMYDTSRLDISRNIDMIQREYRDIILTASTSFLSNESSLNVITVKGEAVRLTEFSDRLSSIKGIKHCKLLMSRAE